MIGKLFKTIFILFSCLLVAVNLFAEIKLPAIIGSHMVLQQNSEVDLWGWAKPREAIEISVDWDTTTYNTVTEFRSGKWNVKIKTPKAGGPYRIFINGSNKIILEDVLIGEVWLCGGQSNMEISANGGIKQAQVEAPNAKNSMIRFFYVPKYSSAYPQEDTKGKWVVCNPKDMRDFSAVGYFFGKRLQNQLKQPVGLIDASWGGTGAEIWTPAELINKNPAFMEVALKAGVANSCCPNGIGLLYNGMIHPIINFNISGVIWYQGESNRFTYDTYPLLLKTMVHEWRRLWQYDFPFYFVQIAPFADVGSENYVALMRDAQTKCMSIIPKSGMVVISDLVNDVKNIHPQNKKDVGLRLANYALAETYGRKDVVHKSPMYESMIVEGGKIRIWFNNAENGLMSKGAPPTEFYISGKDKKFLPATAIIDGSSVIVFNELIIDPVSVRFGFRNAAISNLFSKEGLPADLFRTDDWDVPTVAVFDKAEKR